MDPPICNTWICPHSNQSVLLGKLGRAPRSIEYQTKAVRISPYDPLPPVGLALLDPICFAVTQFSISFVSLKLCMITEPEDTKLGSIQWLTWIQFSPQTNLTASSPVHRTLKIGWDKQTAIYGVPLLYVKTSVAIFFLAKCLEVWACATKRKLRISIF
jgi:hypothetical protein